MRGQRPSREDYDIFGRGIIIEREGLYFLLGIFWFGLEFGWTVTGVHQVAGSFGLRGQESSRNSGARELDGLCS
jgi:hypothetical protein